MAELPTKAYAAMKLDVRKQYIDSEFGPIEFAGAVKSATKIWGYVGFSDCFRKRQRLMWQPPWQ